MTETPPGRESHENLKKIWKKAIFIIFCLIALIVGSLLIWLFNRPAQGVVRVIAPQATQAEREAILAPFHYDGQYVSFSYPGGYTPRETDLDTVSLEKGAFVAPGSSSRIFAFSVTDLRGKTLDDIPSYRFRNDVQKNVYERERREMTGSDGVFFVKREGGYERTAFILHQGILLTISVSSQAFAEPARIDQDFDVIVQSIDFRE